MLSIVVHGIKKSNINNVLRRHLGITIMFATQQRIPGDQATIFIMNCALIPLITRWPQQGRNAVHASVKCGYSATPLPKIKIRPRLAPSIGITRASARQMQIQMQWISTAGKLMRRKKMKTIPGAQVPKDDKSSRSLTSVLDQSEHIKVLVVEAAAELSSVNTVLKQGLTERDPSPGVENAIEKSEAVEGKVQDASAKLSLVNLALKAEVKKRHVLEEQLAAVTEQGEADRHAAFHDVLTGLPNRALFNDRLEYGLAQAARHGRRLAVMFVDLDDFKIINDTHGHDAGDSVLRIIAGRLKENTRSEDTVSRLGGDEFLYLLMEVGDEHDVSLIAQKLIKSIQTPCSVSKPGFTLSPSVKASIGIALFPQHGTTAKVLIESADMAMYEAKRTKSGYNFAR